MLFAKLSVSNEEELFEILNLDLLVATAGKKGARFIFKKGTNTQIITEAPKVIENMVDDTGAGDSLFAVIIQKYAYTNKIDESFIHKTFELASSKSAEVIKNLGSRLENK